MEIIYSEHFTGTKKKQPEFEKLLKEVSTGDEIIVTKLDRLSRSTRDGLNILGVSPHRYQAKLIQRQL
ncbi:recombinase family protein [Microbacteriaceae bacterium 4G12]